MADSETQSAVQLDFPIPLDELFSLSHNFENLKEVLKWLLDQLNSQGNKIRNLEADGKDKDALIAAFEKRIADLEAADRILTSDGEKLNQRVTVLEDKSRELEEKNSVLEKQKERLEERVSALEGQLNAFDDLRRELEQVKEKSDKNEKGLSETSDKLLDHESRMDENKSRSDKAHDRIDDLEGRVSSMMKRREESSGSTSTTLTFDDLDNMKYEILKEVAKKSDLEDLEGRVRNLERDVKEAKSDIQKTDEKVDGLDERTEKQFTDVRNEIEALRKLIRDLEEKFDAKVDSETFWQEIQNLKMLISSTGGSGDGGEAKNINFGMSPQDQKLLQDLSKKLNALEKRVDDLERNGTGSGASAASEESIQNLSARLKKLEDVIPDDFASKWEQLLADLAKLREDVDQNRKDILDILSQLKNFADKDLVRSLKSQFDLMDKRLLDLTAGGQGAGNGDGGLGMDAGAISDLRDLVDQLRGDFEKFRDEMSKLLEEIEKELQNKVDLDTLWTVENKLLEKLDQLSAALAKKFADKGDTNRGFKNLEKQLNELLMLYVPHADGDDALLSKKYLGGWSCASCEKGLEKLASQRADFQTWNRFPLRDPNDRLARVGPGFSRMLGMIRPESVQHLEKRFAATGQDFHQHQHEEMLPKMRMTDSPAKGGLRPKTSQNSVGRK